MKELRIIPAVLAFLALSLLLAPAGLASIISFDPSSVSLYADGNDSIIVRIDELPEGLAWHTFTVKVSDPAVAEVSQVTFPEWASVNNATIVPSDLVELRGEDTGDQVVPGATGVVLGTIHIRAKDPGSATIRIEGVRIEDDAGVVLEPDAGTASIVVTGRGEDTASREDVAHTTDPAGVRAGESGEQGSSSGRDTSLETSAIPPAPAGTLPLPTPWIVVIVIMVCAAFAVLFLAVIQKI